MKKEGFPSPAGDSALLQRGGGELLHLEALAARHGAAAAELLAGLDRALIVGARSVLEAQVARRLAQQEVREVGEVADLHHREREVAPAPLRVQLAPVRLLRAVAQGAAAAALEGRRP